MRWTEGDSPALPSWRWRERSHLSLRRGAAGRASAGEASLHVLAQLARLGQVRQQEAAAATHSKLAPAHCRRERARARRRRRPSTGPPSQHAGAYAATRSVGEQATCGARVRVQPFRAWLRAGGLGRVSPNNPHALPSHPAYLLHAGAVDHGDHARVQAGLQLTNLGLHVLLHRSQVHRGRVWRVGGRAAGAAGCALCVICSLPFNLRQHTAWHGCERLFVRLKGQ